jgi:radical SAM superfamily enzyme YgiQ (UPF0313 family)
MALPKHKKIFLADLFHVSSENTQEEMVPLGIGYLSSFLNSKYNGNLDIHMYRNANELLSAVRSAAPQIMGFSVRMWNLELVAFCAEKIRSEFPNTLIVCGGPSIDSDPESQLHLWEDLNCSVDYFVYGEGEVPFLNIINNWLECGKLNLQEGSVLFAEGQRVGGDIFDNRNDLESIPSPILDGTLDEFFEKDLRPLIQSSRLCPYRCSFCASGHQMGKLRVFSLERISDELNYIANKYKDRPGKNLYMVDENFGINKQDRHTADILINSYKNIGYPVNMFCYFDKKFNDTTRHIAETLKDINVQGYPLPLQSLNKETMDAIQRINIPVKTLNEMLDWSKEKGVHVGSELIFGLPKETKESFIEAIDYCIDKEIGVVIHTLMMFPGAGINRSSTKKQYSIETKYRPPFVPSYSEIDGNFITEVEEVAISSDSFSYEDYKYIRIIGMLCYAMSGVGLCRPVLQYLNEYGYKPSYVWGRMIETILFGEQFVSGKEFFSDFIAASEDELFDTKEQAISAIKKMGAKPARLNTLFAARLIYQENWVFDWFRQEFQDQLGDDQEVFEDLLTISEMEWIDSRDPNAKIDIDICARTREYLDGVTSIRSEYRKSFAITLEPTEISVNRIKVVASNIEQDSNFYYNLLSELTQWELLRRPFSLATTR